MSATAAATTIIDAFKNVHTEHDRLCYLNYCCGYVVFLAAGLNSRAEIRKISAATEGAYVAVTAIKDNLFVEDGNSVKFLRTTVSYASLEYQFNVETNINGVKASVELNGIKAYMGLRDASALNSDSTGVINDLLTEVGQKNPCIFKTIAVSARVKYPVSLYTNSFLAYAGAA